MSGINVWIAVEPNGHRLVRTAAKDKGECKNLARDWSAKATRSTTPLWIDMYKAGWTVQPYTLTKGHAHD